MPLVVLLALPREGTAQSPSPEAIEEAKRLVAMVECRTGSASRIGAGIVFGDDLNAIYIATAEHVVEPCRSPSSGGVVVRLRNRPDEEVPATVSGESDRTLDLAVLKVTRAAPSREADSVPFDRLGDSNAIARGSRVFSLGWRNRPWALNVNPDLVAENAGERIYYESNTIGPGHSGGALLSQEMLVVGMLRSDQPPEGEAIRIDRLLERVETWGYPVRLVPQSVPQSLVSLALGRDHMCGLDTRGAAYCWGGHADYGGTALGTGVLGNRSKRVVGGLRFRSIAAGDGFTCGLTTDGVAYCWGRSGPELANSTNQLAEPTRVSTQLRFSTLTIGGNHMCGIADNGSAYCWGENELGELGDNTLRNSRTPVRVATDLKFAKISAGGSHTCALTQDGTAHCWGRNLNGEAGIGSTEVVRAPSRVAGDLRFAVISASPDEHSCGVTLEGYAYCWGKGGSGQLGSGGSEGDQHTPGAVAGNRRFVSVTTGAWYSCALDQSGVAYCWGNNEKGQLGSGSEGGTAVPVPVAGGLRFRSIETAVFYGALTCGLTTDGIPYCWGRTDASNQVGADFPVDVSVLVPRRIHP